MRGWTKVQNSDWPEIAEFFTASGRRWPESMIESDLRWWIAQRDFNNAKIPGYREMMKRWNVGNHVARRMMREVLGPTDALPKRDRSKTAAASTHRDQIEREIPGANNAASVHDRSSIDARPDTRAYGEEEEEEKNKNDRIPDPPQPTPTPEPPQAPEPGSAVELTLIPQQPDPAPKPADTTESRIDQVCAEWWRLWQIRAEKHPQGKPTKPHLPKAHRKAIRSVVAGKDPMITVDEAIWICRWMFYGTDFDAVHLRGENPKKEGATINQYLNPCSAYRVEKLGDKLHKAAVFRDNYETMKQLAVEQAKGPAPAEIPDYRREWEEALKAGKIQGRRSMK